MRVLEPPDPDAAFDEHERILKNLKPHLADEHPAYALSALAEAVALIVAGLQVSNQERLQLLDLQAKTMRDYLPTAVEEVDALIKAETGQVGKTN